MMSNSSGLMQWCWKCKYSDSKHTSFLQTAHGAAGRLRSALHLGHGRDRDKVVETTPHRCDTRGSSVVLVWRHLQVHPGTVWENCARVWYIEHDENSRKQQRFLRHDWLGLSNVKFVSHILIGPVGWGGFVFQCEEGFVDKTQRVKS